MLTLTQVRRYAMSLKDVTEEPHFDFSSFRVRGKIFVTVPPGDEYIHIFVPADVRDEALASHPDFLEELYWGKKVLGLRATLSVASPLVIKQLVQSAWQSKAPKKA
jgi:hypothetical protein